MATLARTVETAICALLSAGSTALYATNPQPSDSTVQVALPAVNVIATPRGEERLYQTGIYDVDVLVTATNKPRSSPTPDNLIADAALIFAQLNTLTASELRDTFQQFGIYVWGVVPSQQVTSTVVGDNRQSTCGITLVCRFSEDTPLPSILIRNIDTGTYFSAVITGSDSAPVLTIEETTTPTTPVVTVRGPNGGVIVTNIDSGTEFEVVASGSDSGPQFTILET